MESKGILAMLLVLMLPLSGCLGFGDDGGEEAHDHNDHDHDCPGDDHMEPAGSEDGNSTENATAFVLPVELGLQANETEGDNATVQTTAMSECPGNVIDDVTGAANETVQDLPNELPVGVITLTKEDGTVMGPYDSIRPGETITFSAEGSSDPDGSIDLIGLTVKDANSTRTVQLYENGAFVTQTLSFPKAGPINATARILDSAGEGIVMYILSGVDDVFTGSESGPWLVDNQSSGCRPTADSSSASIIGNNFIAQGTFTVSNGAQWISVKSTGTRVINICDSGNARLATGSNAAATDNAEWPVGSGYKVVGYPTTTAAGPTNTITWELVVHYVPKAPA